MTVQDLRDHIKSAISAHERLMVQNGERADLGVYPKTLKYEGMVLALGMSVDALEEILERVNLLENG